MNNLEIVKKTLIVDEAIFAEEYYFFKISRVPQGISNCPKNIKFIPL